MSLKFKTGRSVYAVMITERKGLAYIDGVYDDSVEIVNKAIDENIEKYKGWLLGMGYDTFVVEGEGLERTLIATGERNWHGLFEVVIRAHRITYFRGLIQE